MENGNEVKKLTRSVSDRKIAGVCGGLAKYFNVDPTVIRILALVALLCASVGFWAYIIVWICAPRANNVVVIRGL